MAKEKTAKGKPAKAAATGFSADERAAMRERAAELKAQGAKADGEQAVRTAIAKMAPADRALAQWLHDAVKAEAPQLAAKTWYGMPAYARDDQVICFFQAAGKFKARYATIGFSDKAALDDGALWPTTYAVTKLDKAAEAKVRALIRKAVGG